MLPPFQLKQAVQRLVREEWGRILASLTKSVGNLQLAEDALQDAVEIALKDWVRHGLPDSPAAWLIQTARRKAIDQLRRQARFRDLQPSVSYSMDLEASNDLIEQLEAEEFATIPDKRLELMFTCCHPALEKKTRVALTLRALGGLSTEEIARAFLDKPSAMAQRLVRARHKIKAAGIPYQIPDEHQLKERLDGVLTVVYFIFNEGYSAMTGEQLIRLDLSQEAIRLARILHSLLPEISEIGGLLALMLLHDARRPARLDSHGDMIALEHQDRARWDKGQVSLGTDLLKATLAMQQIGPYQLQAAISAIHSESEGWEQTDWAQIESLYELLYRMQPSPVIRLNQALAVSYARSPEEGLKLLDSIVRESSLIAYQPYQLAWADIAYRAGLQDVAVQHMEKALSLTHNQREKTYVSKRLKTMKS